MSALRAVPRWRLGAGAAVLAALLFFAARLAPVYIRNYQLQLYVDEITQNAGNHARPDDLLRSWVLRRAHELDLPLRSDNIRVKRDAEGVRIDVRYIVRVDLPLYTVDLHFYPGAGSR